MTIGIGMLCRDGIVLAADTREVWANLGKRHNEKIRVHGFQGMLNYVVVSAGDGDLMRMFLDDLDDRVWAAVDEAMNSTDQFVDVAELAREAARTLFERNIAPLLSQAEKPEHCALIGIKHERGLCGALYKVAPPSTLIEIKDNDPSNGLHEAIGLGWILAEPMLKQFHSNLSGVEGTADLAVYILKHVKDGVQDCDGYSDVVLQRNDGAVEALHRDYVRALEEWYAELDVIWADLTIRATHEMLLNPQIMDSMNRIIARKPKQVRYSLLQ